jgi:two-component system CheB/CheR fusion protein
MDARSKKSHQERKTDRQTSSPLKSKSKQKPTNKLPRREIPPAKHFPIIGMGASAGGLDAFEKFFKIMPPNSGAAFVLISHLSPDQKSLMPEILRKHTRMPISQIEDGMVVKPNCIYVIPPNRDAILKNGALHLIEPFISRGIRHPIDVFFRSLADDQAEKAICAILSGTGTEGTLGLKAIKAEGGIVLVQRPESASYDGMPSSAIATGLVDYTAPPEEMPEQIMDYIKKSFGRIRMPVEKEIVPADNLLDILAVIREHTGHDFSDYKSSTIKRRIEKRMVIHSIEDTKTYVRYLRENPTEIKTLFKEFLISVTKFFRDPEAFTYLKENILPELFNARPDKSPIRVWVVGCATGEEAYSIAIIFREYMEEYSIAAPIQIFATDIDADAIDTARAGVFPEGIGVDVSEVRLKKYFTKEKNFYRIKKPLREMVVFSLQNVIKDPPFSKIDLICCRNLLIYVDAKLQKRMFNTFHYALKRDGILFLGTSETVGESVDLFSIVDRKWKVYRRTGREGHLPYRAFDMEAAIQHHFRHRAPIAEGKGKESWPAAVQQMINSYVPPCIVVDERTQIRCFHGKTARYLEHAEGESNLNLLDMAKEGLKNKLYMAIEDARQKKQDVYLKSVHVKTDGEYVPVTLSVKLLNQPGMVGWTVVFFEEEKSLKTEVSGKEKPYTKKEATKLVAQLQSELSNAKQSQQMTMEELESSNEELQSANEELQSSNEELQSTNEELETSREELQSLNEELVTVNMELQEKIQQQASAAEEVESLLSNMDIATIFLDSDLRVVRFTPQASEVTNLLDRDIARLFSDIKKNILDTDVDAVIQEVLKSKSPKKMEVEGKNGHPYLMTVTPFRTTENKLRGIVLTFVEIAGVREAIEYTESIVDTVREALIVLDRDLRVRSANHTFYEQFRVKKEDIEGKLIYELGNGQWDIPKLRELLEKILPKKTMFRDYVVEHEFPDIGRKKMLLNARQISYRGHERQMILLAIEDMTWKSDN